MAETNLICGCGGRVGYDLRYGNNYRTAKFHIKYYCRRNCGLNFNFTKTFIFGKYIRPECWIGTCPIQDNIKEKKAKAKLTDADMQKMGQQALFEAEKALKIATRLEGNYYWQHEQETLTA